MIYLKCLIRNSLKEAIEVKVRIISWLMVATFVACLPSMGLAKMSEEDFMLLCKEGSHSEVQAAIEAGADVKARTERGVTPLHSAAWNNPNPEVITALLKAGADPKARGESGILPIDLAKENEHLRGTDVYWTLNEVRY